MARKDGKTIKTVYVSNGIKSVEVVEPKRKGAIAAPRPEKKSEKSEKK